MEESSCHQGFESGSGVFAGSGSGFQISLDPDPRRKSVQKLLQKLFARKKLKKYDGGSSKNIKGNNTDDRGL